MSVVWGSKVQRVVLFLRVSIIFLCSLFFLLPDIGVADGSRLPVPDWISPRRIVSNDGYARLEWETGVKTEIGLFRLIEERAGQLQASYVDRKQITVFRVEPGNYKFRLQACVKEGGEAPVCGKRSRKLVLRVTEDVNRETRESADQERLFEAAPSVAAPVAGGPDQLRPGLWYNPTRNGHGWSFYWSNRLALPESHALHGNEYDLLGIWYTYEAKTRYLDAPVLCGQGGFGESCQWSFEDYRPFVARLKLVHTGDNEFSGGVYVTRNGQEIHAGSVSVSFGQGDDSALVSWSVDFKKQHLSGSDPLTLLVGSQTASTLNDTHYSGLWEVEGRDDYTVVDNLGAFSEAVEVLYYDDAGDPAWIQAGNAGVPLSSETPLCFYSVFDGYAPDSSGSLAFASSGCNFSQKAGAGNRNGSRVFSDFEEGDFWASFTLPPGDSGGAISIGSASSPATLKKVASFHRIQYAEPESGCVISDISPLCHLKLTWFTDGDYPQASAFALNQATGLRQKIPSPFAPAVVDHAVQLDQPGSYVFELRMGSSATSSLLARSAEIHVAGVEFPAPYGLAVDWLDEGARDFRVQWDHPAPQSVTRFELEETDPGGGTRVYPVAPESGMLIDINHSDGPYGDYTYRARACYRDQGLERCSDWSAGLNWYVDDPQIESGHVIHPWADNAAGSGSLITNVSFNHAMGYHFRPETDGLVTELGGYFNGSKTVKLFLRESGELIAQAVVNSNNDWSYTSIAPVQVMAGKEYTVAVYLAGSGGSYYSGAVLPVALENITLLGTTYISTSTNPLAIPVNLRTTQMYGQADIGFEAAAPMGGDEAAPDIPPEPATHPGYAFDAASVSVGSTKGAFSVDASGAANYRVPILAAPGSGGLSPNLSLDYNSQLPNGIAGVGWNLGGLSSITRCAATPEQDGLPAARGVSLTFDDRFCLDGQRLMVVTGSYGKDGAEYRTEIDGFLRVVSYGAAGNGPRYFRVWHGDGSVSEYGNSGDSRLEARTSGDTQTVLSWARNLFQDGSTNYMEFVYGENVSGPVEHFIERVRYAGNMRAGTAPNSEIRFVYDDRRSDVPVSWLRGAALARGRLLTRIDSLSKAHDKAIRFAFLRSYYLSYNQDGYGRKAIVSIQECSDSSRGFCYPETTFDWLKNEHMIGAAGIRQAGVFPRNLKGIAIADVNGDGRPDLLPVSESGDSFSFKIAYAKVDGRFSANSTSYPIPNDGQDDHPVQMLAIDLNADGYQDVIYPKTSPEGVNWVARLSDSAGLGAEIVVASDCCFLAHPRVARVMDFNGDGLADLLTHRVADESTGKGDLVVLINKYQPGGSAGFLPARTLKIDYPEELFPEGPTSNGWYADDIAPQFAAAMSGSALGAQPFDYNGDGKVDLVARIGRQYEKCADNCTPSVAATVPSSLTRQYVFSTEQGVGPATSAADSPAGVQRAIASFYMVFESNGEDRFVLRQVVAAGAGADCAVPDACDPWSDLPAVEVLMPVDINADGLADLAFRDGLDDWHYQVNTGTGFLQPVFVARPPDDELSHLGQFTDLNGNGFPDFLYPDLLDKGSANWVVHSNDLGSGFGAGETSGIRFGNRDEGDSNILADFTGDGMLDNLFIDFRNGVNREDTTRLYMGRNLVTGKSNQANNVISAVTTATGARTQLSYRPLTDGTVYTRTRNASDTSWGRGAAVFDLLAPVYVVSDVSVSTPTFESHSARSHLEYHYVGAKVQAGGRGFLGFGEVISWNPATGIRSNTRYRQDFPFMGRVAETSQVVTGSSSKFRTITETITQTPPAWTPVDRTLPPPKTGAGEVLISFSASQWEAAETFSGKGAWWPFVSRALQRTQTLGGNFESLILTSNTYQSFGRMAQSIAETFASESGPAFSKVTTQNSYFTPDQTRWILRKVSATAVTHQRPGLALVTRKSGFTYDANSGLLLSEVIEPDKSKYRVTTDYVLDDFGNHIRTTVTGSGMAPRSSRQEYDTLGRFVIKALNHYGQTISSVRDWNAHGLALDGTNIDGVRTLVSADPMGHAYLNWTQTGAWERSISRWGGTPHCPSATAYYMASDGGGKPAQTTCYDLAGREIRVATEGFRGRTIFVDSYFDESGRAGQVSEPYFQDESPLWNVTVYDAIGRPQATEAADGSEVYFGYAEDVGGRCNVSDPRAKMTTNSLGQHQVQVRNVLGETVAVYGEDCGLLSYRYDAIGNLVRVTGADKVSVDMVYDAVGRKVTSHDPDKGSWKYGWNAVGELVRQLDGSQQAIDYKYDSMGRVVERAELTQVASLQDSQFNVEQTEYTTWQNSTSASARGKSQPRHVIYQEGRAGDVIQRIDNSYDHFGRLELSVSTQGGMQFFEETTYDEYGRVFQKFDASGDYRGLKYQYKTDGYLNKLIESRDGENGVVYQEILDMDARGNVTYMRLGNGVEAIAGYNRASGILEKLEAYDRDGAELQEVDYLFDSLGNLQSRHDRSNGRDLNESFSYDNLNRLLRVELTAPLDGIVSPLTTLAMTYDPSGNIRWKSDVGTYTYGQGSAGPHAVTSAGSDSFTYDGNGNQVSGAGRDIQYSVFDKAVKIEKDGEQTEFTYGVGNRRIARVDQDVAGGLQTTHYIGSVELVEKEGSSSFKRHIAGVAVSEFYPSTKISVTHYRVKDHLGSIHNMTDESGEIANAIWMSHAAFGDRRGADWRSPLTSVIKASLNKLTTRGFTGHEHIDGMGVIHMNGRIYDPRLGRFLQADPIVQAPTNAQSLNRYSYALNNPLSLTDPSGYFFKRFFKRWGPIIAAIALSVVLPGPGGLLATHIGIGNIYAQAAITGFIAGAITAGSLKGAVIGAITAVAIAGVVEAFSTAQAGTALAPQSDITPQAVDLEHLYSPNGIPAGLYEINVDSRGIIGGVSRISVYDIESGKVIFTNGVKNGFEEAVKNGTRHLHQAGLLKQSYVLNFNPTEGFFPDLLEASRDVIGAHTGWTHSTLSRNLANTIHQLSVNGITGIQLVGHSQGGAITASALRYASKAGLNLSSLSGGGVALHGAPVNAWMARTRLSKQAGVGVVSRAQFGDAVHVLGGLNVSNPLELPIALLRFPALFSSDPGLSPHSLPCGGSKIAICSH